MFLRSAHLRSGRRDGGKILFPSARTVGLVAGMGLFAACSSGTSSTSYPPDRYHSYWGYPCYGYYDSDAYGCGSYPYYGGGRPGREPPSSGAPPQAIPPAPPPSIATLPGRTPPPRNGNPPMPNPPVTVRPIPGKHPPPGHGGGGGDDGGGSGRGDDTAARPGHGGLKQGAEPAKASPGFAGGKPSAPAPARGGPAHGVASRPAHAGRRR
jgi:hypothetical protein